jgi:hypothetical protein
MWAFRQFTRLLDLAISHLASILDMTPPIYYYRVSTHFLFLPNHPSPPFHNKKKKIKKKQFNLTPCPLTGFYCDIIYMFKSVF